MPGPGNYNAELVKSRKNIKIGEKLRDSIGNNVPGPGVNVS